MNPQIKSIFSKIITLKQQRGAKNLIQKLQQKADQIQRQASDKQATNKST